MNAYEQVTIALFAYVSLCMSAVLSVYVLFNRFNKHVLNMLTMLAVGTLVGDAFLHLIPKSLGLHHKTSERNESVHEHVVSSGRVLADDEEREILFKSILLVASIYGLYVVSVLIVFFKCGHEHNHDGNILQEKNTKNAQRTLHTFEDKIRTISPRADRDHYLESFIIKEPEEIHPELKSCSMKTADESHLIHPPDQSRKTKNKLVPQLVYAVILGSFLHNISDGLAIGVAFSDNVSGGLSTTIAVLCHEIPHVIGHFVIIHLAGVPVHTALFVVMVTYISTFIGAYTGVAIGAHFKATGWIFAITAGMFLHISLVQLLPEMIRSLQDTKSFLSAIFQNFGFLLGFIIMVMIAIYEESISIHLHSK